jgi:peptidoglycan/LPS O-acetylase OafA/YrhL
MKTLNPIYLSNLTALRGIAALLTVFFHIDLIMSNGQGMLISHNNSWMITRLYLMVDFFFILSGFIMLHVYGEWFAEKVTMVEFKRFTRARFARVYPLHLVVLLLVLLISVISSRLGLPKVPVFDIENHVYSFVTNLFLLQSMNFHNWFSWNHPAWSISTEWWMYMLFPFLVRPFLKLDYWGRALIAALCFVGYVGIMLWLVPIVTFPPEIPFVKTDPAKLTIGVGYQYGFLRCLCGFVLGMMLYQGYQQSWGKAWLSNGYVLLASTIGMLLSMHFNCADVLTVSFLPFILLSAGYGSTRVNVFLQSIPLQKLGDWSFSIYMLHQTLLSLIGAITTYQNLGNPALAGPPPVPSMATGWVIALAFIPFCLFISWLTYRFIEVPARRWINPK